MYYLPIGTITESSAAVILFYQAICVWMMGYTVNLGILPEAVYCHTIFITIWGFLFVCLFCVCFVLIRRNAECVWWWVSRSESLWWRRQGRQSLSRIYFYSIEEKLLPPPWWKSACHHMVVVSSSHQGDGLLGAGHWLLLLAGEHSPVLVANQPWNRKFMILAYCVHCESRRMVRKVKSKEWEISSA